MKADGPNISSSENQVPAAAMMLKTTTRMPISPLITDGSGFASIGLDSKS